MKLLVNSGKGFRSDLEGVRGIGLVLIMLGHLIEWPQGGFIVLDIFFVMSGYLITGLLLIQYFRDGRVQTSKFYRRRIRRLAPVATLVIVVTILLGWVIFGGQRAVDITWDGFWAFLLVANWNFIQQGTDYFASFASPTPFLHFWSLAVEEQFYIVWPTLLTATLAIGVWARKRRRHRRSLRDATPVERTSLVPLVVVLVIFTLVSFSWGVYQSNVDPGSAYFSTLTRAWELSLGGLIVLANPLWERTPAWLRVVLGWGGLALMAFAVLTFSPFWAYPGFVALVPAIAMVMILIGGSGGSSHLVIVDNPVVRYFGQISYSGYLWHWPIFVYMAVLFGKESPIYLFGAFPIAIILSALTFHFIEDPIRKSSWLEPSQRRSRRRRRPASFQRSGPIIAAAASATALAAVVLVAVLPPRGDDSSSASQPRPSASSSAPSAITGDGQAVARIAAAIGEASQATAWPQSVVTSIEAGEDSFGGELGRECLDTDENNADDCVLGDETATKNAVILGDSVAISWVPGLATTLRELGYRVNVLTHGLCPFSSVDVVGALPGTPAPEGFTETCNDHRDWSFQRARDIGATLVIASDSELQLTNLVDTSDTERVWREGMQKSIEALAAPDRQVVVLSPPPGGRAIAECYTRLSGPEACMGKINPEWFTQYSATVDAYAAAANDNAHFIDTRKLFCAADELCPAFAGDTVVHADAWHITSTYSIKLADALNELLRKALSLETTAGSTS